MKQNMMMNTTTMKVVVDRPTRVVQKGSIGNQVVYCGKRYLMMTSSSESMNGLIKTPASEVLPHRVTSASVEVTAALRNLYQKSRKKNHHHHHHHSNLSNKNTSSTREYDDEDGPSSPSLVSPPQQNSIVYSINKQLYSRFLIKDDDDDDSIITDGKHPKNTKDTLADNDNSTSIGNRTCNSTTTESLPSVKDVTTIRKRKRECNEPINEDIGIDKASMHIDHSLNVNPKIISRKEPPVKKKAETRKKMYDMMWKEMYQRLVTYKDEHNTLVVSNSVDRKLNEWIRRQRRAKRRNQLSTERISILASIGFVWGVHVHVQEPWNTMYQRLVAYKDEHKTTVVSKSIDSKLCTWIAMQRLSKKKSRLSSERIALLDSIEFVWEIRSMEGWDEMYLRLCTYREQHDSTDVPQRYDQDRALGIWVRTQRASCKNGSVPEQRLKLLNSIDFMLESQHSPIRWDKMYRRLCTYREQHNSTEVPKEYDQDRKLGNWVHSQRTAYKKGELLQQREDLLNEIGFVWDVFHTKWMNMYQRLATYKQKHMNTLVPITYKQDREFGKWVYLQRTAYMNGRLSEQRLKLLNDIYFTWVAGDNSFIVI
jgi:hypothetical protein